ncbi:MAG TPA: glycosyltransferase family 39 protein [Thermoguttaceae bacterium]|nr:glycosyltransferase family 39 protein [Thermoguttaceae bacterium]
MPDVIAARVRGLLNSGQWHGIGLVGAAMALAAVLATAGLTNHPFWDDEANTAIYGRNLLEHGRLTAWDGTNVLGYAYGGALGPDLGRELRVPPLPAYVAAAGMFLFGKTTFGARILFVAAGVVSIGLIAVWLRRHFSRRFPYWLPSLILALSPAYLLLIRNCRYYALGIMLTLLIWIFWAPGTSRGRTSRGSLFDRRSLLRYAGVAAAVVLLVQTHYLNAAAVLVTLPLFFIDRRYRQPRQYVLLGIVCCVAATVGGWILLTANPFRTEYAMRHDWLFPSALQVDWWPHFYKHLGWLLRDLGTHEFFPWCLVVVLLVPFLPLDTRRLRPLALRGCILVGVTLVYVVLAAALTPSDMGKGPLAEMRYVVPLVAVGCAVGSLALVILWRALPALAPLVAVVLLMSNVLHLGFLARRVDDTSAWWPPTLYRYVHEIFNDYESGDEAMIALLKKLPPGTTVRTWPTYMTHPAMFEVPALHYCDQLTEAKQIDEDLRGQLPDYVFVERARPQVVLVPALYLSEALYVLEGRFGAGSYELRKSLPPDWHYTSKPEIPARFFSRPSAPRVGMSVLVATDGPAAEDVALRKGTIDVAAHDRLGREFARDAMFEPAAVAATVHFVVVLQSNPAYQEDYLRIANALMQQQTPWIAMPYYEAIVEVDPENVSARMGLAMALWSAGRSDLAADQLRQALQVVGKDSPAARQIQEILKQIEGKGTEEGQAAPFVPQGVPSSSDHSTRKHLAGGLARRVFPHNLHD